MNNQNILIWLPWPMGDAIMSTAGLGCIREVFSEARINFLANPTVRQILEPNSFCDHWVETNSRCPFKIARELKKYEFDTAILFKNSIASAMAVFAAGIDSRIGYSREFRGVFLTDPLKPSKDGPFRFAPTAAKDYYLAIASWLGADTFGAEMKLEIDPQLQQSVSQEFSDILTQDAPAVIMVPGGAFGPSKRWAEANFAQVADKLIEKYGARVFISVSPDMVERQIGEKICSCSKHKDKIINLGEKNFSLGKLKALFSLSDLVITNDTGPRHIAIALNKKVLTLFGPNNPAWTDSGYDKETQIIASAKCVPCDKPRCKAKRHFCMASISPETVFKFAAEKLESD